MTESTISTEVRAVRAGRRASSHPASASASAPCDAVYRWLTAATRAIRRSVTSEAAITPRVGASTSTGSVPRRPARSLVAADEPRNRHRPSRASATIAMSRPVRWRNSGPSGLARSAWARANPRADRTAGQVTIATTSTPTATDPSTADRETVGWRSSPVTATGPHRSASSTTRAPSSGPSATAGTAISTASAAAITPSCSGDAPRDLSIAVSTARDDTSTDADSPTPYSATPTSWRRIAAITAPVAPMAVSVAAASDGSRVVTSRLATSSASPIAPSTPEAPRRRRSRSAVVTLAGSTITRHRTFAVPSIDAKSSGATTNGPTSVNEPLIVRPSRSTGWSNHRSSARSAGSNTPTSVRASGAADDRVSSMRSPTARPSSRAASTCTVAAMVSGSAATASSSATRSSSAPATTPMLVIRPVPPAPAARPSGSE